MHEQEAQNVAVLYLARNAVLQNFPKNGARIVTIWNAVWETQPFGMMCLQSTVYCYNKFWGMSMQAHARTHTHICKQVNI